MRTEALDLPVAFVSGEAAGRTAPGAIVGRVRTIQSDERDGAWSGFQLVFETDVATLGRIEARGYFHDALDNRLEAVQGGFNPDLPIFLELTLRPSQLNLLPSPGGSLAPWLEALFAFEASAGSELRGEDAWNATRVWQEHHLDPSIGDGVIMVGYRTVFSPPRDETDRLRRRGLVSRTIVEALIENGLPVRFELGPEAFELGFTVGEETYTCQIHPDDAAVALSLAVSYSDEIPDAARARVDEAIARANDEVPVGAFELRDGRVRYVHQIQVDRSLVSPSWVIEAVRAGISVAHHYRQQFATPWSDEGNG